jgi:hypothetical protein
MNRNLAHDQRHFIYTAGFRVNFSLETTNDVLIIVICITLLSFQIVLLGVTLR